MLHLIRLLFLLYNVKAAGSILKDNGPQYKRTEPVTIPQTLRRPPTTETQTVIQTDGAVAFTYALISSPSSSAFLYFFLHFLAQCPSISSFSPNNFFFQHTVIAIVVLPELGGHRYQSAIRVHWLG